MIDWKWCCWCGRHCQMGDTRVVSTGQWWTHWVWEGHWFTLCVQERTKWWGPQRFLQAKMRKESTLILRGPICVNSHKNTIGLMLLHSKASFSGKALPTPPTSSCLCYEWLLPCLSWLIIIVYFLHNINNLLLEFENSSTCTCNPWSHLW